MTQQKNEADKLMEELISLVKDDKEYVMNVSNKHNYYFLAEIPLLSNSDIAFVVNAIYGGRVFGSYIVLGIRYVEGDAVFYYFNKNSGNIESIPLLFTGVPGESSIRHLQKMIDVMRNETRLPAFKYKITECARFVFDVPRMTVQLQEAVVDNASVSMVFYNNYTKMIDPESENALYKRINIPYLADESTSAPEQTPVESEEVLNEFFEALNELKDASYNERRLSDKNFSIIERSLSVVKRAYRKAKENRKDYQS